jgi:cell division septation protein DedD
LEGRSGGALGGQIHVGLTSKASKVVRFPGLAFNYARPEDSHSMKATAMDPISVRNLEQIQETERGLRAPRFATALLGALGVGALVITAIMTLKRGGEPAKSSRDPLAELIEQAKNRPGRSAEQLDPSKVTFAQRLADQERATTALAAVKDEQGRLVTASVLPPGFEPPAATDRLPVVPLPAGSLLQATPATDSPQDSLTALASNRASAESLTEPAGPGGEGGYQIQVSSFREQADADRFVEQLRKRGHRSYRQPAYVVDRGLWHRVRIGPFKTKYEALQYQSGFEKKERMSTFLVDPERVERQKANRAAKVAARDEH